MDLRPISTTDLVDELKTRSGIIFHHCPVSSTMCLETWDREGAAPSGMHTHKGPVSAVIITRWE